MREAEDWISLYLEGQIPAGEEAAFNSWLQSEPENLELLIEQLELHGSLKASLQKGALGATGRIRAIRKGRLTRRSVTPAEPRPWIWMVAVILLALAALPFLWQTGKRVRSTPEPLSRREAPPVEPEAPPVPPSPTPRPEPPRIDLTPKKEETPLSPPPPAPTPALIVPEPVPSKVDLTIVSVAELKEAKGEVLVGKMPAKAGQGLSAGDGVETIGKDASALIVFPDGTKLELQGETQVRDLSVEKEKRLFLVRGSLEAKVTKQSAAMAIETPQAEARVLGTTLRLDVRSGSTLLEVDEGKVRLTRTADQKAVDVGAGAFATSAELKAKPLVRTAPLLALDFEDATAPGVQLGKILPGPNRPGNRGCLAGQEVPADRLVRVLFADDRSGLFTLREGAVLTFDYWVADRVEALDVYVWDKTRRASIGTSSLLTLTKEKWTRATIPFSEFVSKTGVKLQDGDLVTQLTIQTGGTNGGGPLFVDNVDVTVVRKK